MTRMQYWIAAFVAGAAVSAAASAVAAPLPFTWNPAGASPALGGSAFTADTIFTTNYLTDVGQLDGSGRARAIEVVTGFSLGGNPVSPAGFGSSYGLYFDYQDTHTNGPPPEIIKFSSVNITLKADPGNQNGAAFATVGGVGFANTGATGEANDITLATGSLVSSSTFLNVATGVLDARSATTFAPAAGEAGFFVSPRPDASVLLSSFASNSANFTSTPQPDGTSITVFNGFTSTYQLVPEPSSLPLLVSGLLGAIPLLRRPPR